MRIAHILPWPGIGGTEHSTHQLAGFQVSRGHSVVLYHLAEAAGMAELIAASGLESAVYRPEFPSYRQPWKFLRASLALARDFRRRGIEVVHCADLLAAFHAGHAAQMARIPVVSHVRCIYDKLPPREQQYLWPVKHFVFISKAVRDALAYRPAAGRGTVIYTGFDIPVFDRREAADFLRSEFGISPDESVVGMAARIAELKDFHTLARAASIVLARRPEVRFLLVGDYTQPEQRPHYERVRRWLNESGVEHRFLFTGHRTDATRLLAGMDVSVLCTHSEGFGRVVIEAMAQGTPVIGTAIDGVQEIIHHGENGLLHPHKDHEDLARGILSLLDDPEYAAELAAAGRAEAIVKFSSDAFVNQIDSVYRYVAQ